MCVSTINLENTSLAHIGLGAFLAQSLLGKQLSRAFAHEIDVKGSWADPQVIPRQREIAPVPAPGG